jgi:hypothetical protein
MQHHHRENAHFLTKGLSYLAGLTMSRGCSTMRMQSDKRTLKERKDMHAKERHNLAKLCTPL